MEDKRTVGLCGIACDAGAAHLGARMGPEAMRVAGISSLLQGHHYHVKDYGDVHQILCGTGSSEKKLNNLSSVVDGNRQLFERVLQILHSDEIPLVMGGDHSFALGSIGAVSTYCHKHSIPLKVIWFDAHADFNSPESSPSGNIHGMVVRLLTGEGAKELLDIIAPHGYVKEGDIYQLGIRSIDMEEKVALQKSGLHVYEMSHVNREGIGSIIKSIVADCEPDTHIHVSFDVDGLDPIYAPGVGTTEFGGLSYSQASQALSILGETGLVGSIDVFELNPALDIRNQTAKVMTQLMGTLLPPAFT